MTNEAQVLPFLFAVMFGFILVNLLVTWSIYSFSKIKNIRFLTIYWGVMLATYVMQGPFQKQNTEMPVLLSWGFHIAPMMMLSKFLFDSLEMRFPFKRYLIQSLLGFVISAALKLMNFPFNVSAMPLCFFMALMLFEPGIASFRKPHHTKLQKSLAVVFFLGGIHGINFALFRMVPGTQIVGYGTTLALYQIVSIVVLALAFEEYSKKEEIRLKGLVAERTDELHRTLQVKDTLFKVVLHDIANPITGQQWLIQKHNKGKLLTEEDMQKLFRLSTLVKDVIKQVRDINVVKSGEMAYDLKPVNLDECLDDMQLIFEGQLAEKQINLIIDNELPPRTYFLADQKAFTTSVICNLVSNAIKFSSAQTDLHIRAFLREGKVVIEVEDQGIGMPQEMSLGIFDPSKKKSRLGTFGERGTGYGMPLVKSFVDYFGGAIEVESRPMEINPENHGTKVTVTLNQTSIQ